MKMPRGRMHSSGDIRQFAQECKNRLIDQFTNQIQNDFHDAYNNQNYDPNIMGQHWLNANINNSKIHYSSFSPKRTFNYQDNNSLSNNDDIESNNYYYMTNHHAKRNQSSDSLQTTKIPAKDKSSLFKINDNEKGDDYICLDDIKKEINITLWEYAITQKGSRNLQKLLNSIDSNEIDKLLDEINGHFKEVMTDVYGNYFCQKLIQSCSSEQRIYILKNVKFKINFLDIKFIFFNSL